MKQVKLVGNDKAIKRLGQLLPATKAILLSGLSGVGKFHAAEQAALVVADLGDCISHRGPLSVDYAREIREQTYFKASGSKGRAFILECEKYSPESLNALLKVLEEPPPNTFFFLVSSVSLPSTIVSRCQRVGFQAMTKGEVVEALVQQAWSQATASRYAATGSVGQAIEEFSYEEARTNVTTLLAACTKGEWDTITRCVGKWGSLEVHFLRERLWLLVQTEHKKRPDLFDVIEWLSRDYTCPTNTLLLAARMIIMKKIV
jgi:DNA polymerase III delta prime subunit